HLIIHESRFSDGTRKVNRISEIVGLEGEQITMQDLFAFEQTGISAEGAVQGLFRPTGSAPTFLEEIRIRGIPMPVDIFDPARGISL
ncbi:MAG: CpaF family protein, partial [Kiritimatiellia bacterium]|nr:CpaF family protein [Kiritimatiellia bacterium]